MIDYDVVLWQAVALALTVLSLIGVMLVILWRTEFTTRRTDFRVRGVHLMLAGGSAAAIVCLLFLPWPVGDRAMAAVSALSLSQLLGQVLGMRRWPDIVASSTIPADFADSHKCKAPTC